MAQVHKGGRHVEGGAAIRLPTSRRENGPLAGPIHGRAWTDTGCETQQMGSRATHGRAVHSLCGAGCPVTGTRDGDLFRPAGCSQPRINGSTVQALPDIRGKPRNHELS
eukprot:2890890-Amphidinium_carterae.1